MSFDFDAAIAKAVEEADSKLVEACVLGPSGGGKSGRAGTFGVKTLFLYSKGETHGVRSAKQFADKNLVPVRYDHNSASADESLDNLLGILADHDKLRALGIKAIFVDGASELEQLIRSSTKWAELCKTDKGKHNTFNEPKVTVTLFRPIIEALKDAQFELGVHVAMSLIVDVKEYGEYGDIVECQPRILGYGVAEAIIQQFGDTLVVSKMTNPKTGESTRKFQFMTDVVKTAKEETGVVKKSINFSPRISGVTELPKYLDASFEEVIKLKQKGK